MGHLWEAYGFRALARGSPMGRPRYSSGGPSVAHGSVSQGTPVRLQTKTNTAHHPFTHADIDDIRTQ